jgi:Na+-driven multidrug efflux pump
MKKAILMSMLLPAVLLSGFVFKAPFLVVFLCCYIDEPIRFVLMQWRMYSGKWIKPVTEQGRAALAEFMEQRAWGKKHKKA